MNFVLSRKIGQEFLLEIEGDMIPIVRCQHHLLNLSVSGKLYRNGPQRNIYDKNNRENDFHPNATAGRLTCRSQKANGSAVVQEPQNGKKGPLSKSIPRTT